MLKPHDYGPDGVCNRCSHDSMSSGSNYCEANPKQVLDRHHGMVPNPKYVPPKEPEPQT
jgi:hypothetical protein